MKSINKSLLVAALLGASVSALAQNPGGQNPGSGATSADPSNESSRNNASGARTESDVNPRTGNTETRTTTDSNIQTTQPNTVHMDADVNHNTSVDDMYQPKRKRTFWDRVFGRNKQLDADKTQAPANTNGDVQP